MLIELMDSGNAIRCEDIERVHIGNKGAKLSLDALNWDWGLTFDESELIPPMGASLKDISPKLNTNIVTVFIRTTRLYYLYAICENENEAKEKAKELIHKINKAVENLGDSNKLVTSNDR